MTAGYDGNYRVQIRVPTVYSKHVQGICGDMDGNSNNDYITKAGKSTRDQNEIGESWVVPGAIENQELVLCSASCLG